MATELPDAEIDKGIQGRGGRAKYPWAEWMNGSVWVVQEGVDYTISNHNFVTSLHAKARAKGKKVITRTVGEKTEFQFYTPEA